VLRLVIATPDVHRVHHSTIIEEQNSNYGFFIIWWDKLFSTYTSEPRNGHVDMPIGLQKPSEDCERVDKMLLAPFR
jgi:sterol desaturase/sphingolipid hydroxylase (fatty acid hydroxylase superfamily)